MAKPPAVRTAATAQAVPTGPAKAMAAVGVSAVVGTTGSKVHSGLDWEVFDAALRGARAIRTFARMSTDPMCRAILWAVESTLRGVQWTVEPALDSDDPDDQTPTQEATDAAVWLRKVLFEDMRTPWPQIMGEMLSALLYGYSVHEKIFHLRPDGRIGLLDLSPRPQRTITGWQVGEVLGDVEGVKQRTNNAALPEVTIPIAKAVHFTFQGWERNPEGESLLRAAYKPWVYATNLINVEAIGLERNLAGLPVARVPYALLEQAKLGDARAIVELNEWVRLVRDVKMNEQAGMVLASDPWIGDDNKAVPGSYKYDFTLLSAPAGGNASGIDVAIRRHRGEMAMSVLADFLTLGQGASGSWALSTDKTEFFANSLVSIRDAQRACLQASVVDQLWRLNAFDPKTKPRLQAGPVVPPNLSTLVSNIATMAGSGARMFPDTPLENKLRSLMGLPPMSDEAVEADELSREASRFGLGGGEGGEEDDDAASGVGGGAVGGGRRPVGSGEAS